MQSHCERNQLTFKEDPGIRDMDASCGNCQYSWVRKLPSSCTGSFPGLDNHNCTTSAAVQTTPVPTGNSQDTDDNFSDFIFVEPNIVSGTAGFNQRLGAPGPENLTSPVLRTNPDGSGTIPTQRIDPMQATSHPESGCATIQRCKWSAGHIDIRRRFTNHTGQPVTRLSSASWTSQHYRYRRASQTCAGYLNRHPGDDHRRDHSYTFGDDVGDTPQPAFPRRLQLVPVRRDCHTRHAALERRCD